MAKDTNGVIYLEADEDITSAIDKLTKSSSDAVQIVSAKRSSILQSVINLRLLQKAAKDAGKDLALVTSDRVSINLAGRVGLPVASQVGEMAEVPKAGAAVAAADDEIDGGTVGDDEPAAPIPGATSPEPDPKPSRAIPAAAAPAGPMASDKPAKSKVPNIGKMQKRLLWAGAGVLVIAALFGVNFYLTRAQVTLYAKASQVNAQFDLTADPNATTSDIKNHTLAAQQLTLSKTLNATVQATGTKDEGTKANGTMTVYNSYDSNDHALVAGTRFVSGDGHVFVTTSDVTVPGGTPQLSHGTVTVKPGQASVSVTASQNGDGYNLGPTKYTIPGLAADQQSGIYGQGSQMQGGTSKIAKVVTADDVSKAQQAALDSDKTESQGSLKKKANNRQTVLDASFQQNVTSSNTDPNVGEEAQTAHLTLNVTYTALAVAKSDLSELAKTEESQQLGDQSQIYDDGSSKIQLTASGKPNDGAQDFTAHTTAYYGNKIDTTALAKQIKGKRYGDAMNITGQVSGIDKSEISITPGWATSMPHMTSHIHIAIKVSGVGSE